MKKHKCYYWVPVNDKVYTCFGCYKKGSHCFVKKHDRTYNSPDPTYIIRYNEEHYLYKHSYFEREGFNTDVFITKRGLKIEDAC